MVVSTGDTIIYTPAPLFIGSPRFYYMGGDNTRAYIASFTVHIRCTAPFCLLPVAEDDDAETNGMSQSSLKRPNSFSEPEAGLMSQTPCPHLPFLAAYIIQPDQAFCVTPSFVVDTPVDIDLLANDFQGTGTVPIAIDVLDTASANGGSVINQGGGIVTYNPPPLFVGTDSFQYGHDRNVLAAEATVTITVVCGGSCVPPVANDDHAETDANTPVTIDLLANDAPGTRTVPITIDALDTASAHGGCVINSGGGLVTYTPPPLFVGTDSFQYGHDRIYFAPEATVTITVVCGEGCILPLANDDDAEVDANTPITIDLLANDVQGTGTVPIAIDVLDIASAHGGSLINQGGGIVTYIPPLTFVGTDSFQYGIDRNDLEAEATVTITVVCERPACVLAVANDDVAFTEANTPVTIDLLANDVQGTGTVPIAIDVLDTASANGGSVINQGGGIVTYNPPPLFVGTDSFQYGHDRNVLAAEATVTITVVTVGENAAAITENDAAITENDAAIAENDAAISENHMNITKNAADVAELQMDKAESDATLAEAEMEITELEDELEELTAELKEKDGDIDGRATAGLVMGIVSLVLIGGVVVFIGVRNFACTKIFHSTPPPASTGESVPASLIPTLFLYLLSNITKPSLRPVLTLPVPEDLPVAKQSSALRSATQPFPI
ncbi:unnamed protein product [Chrysoparadoxa australica]